MSIERGEREREREGGEREGGRKPQEPLRKPLN